MAGVPLNNICSTQCEIPVLPGCSLREPTRYQTQQVATGAEWTSRSKTSMPFLSRCSIVVVIPKSPLRRLYLCFVRQCRAGVHRPARLGAQRLANRYKIGAAIADGAIGQHGIGEQ